MATLTGKKINTTYDGLLKTEDNQPISTTKKKVTDGYGNETGLSVDSLGNVDVSDDLNVLGNAVVTGSTTANSFIKTGGTSSQFLKADGSLDSNTYITSEADTLDSVTDRGNATPNAISVGNLTAVNTTVESIEINYGLKDQVNSTGSANDILTSTGTATSWQSKSDLSLIDGSGTANKLPKFTDSDTIGNSIVTDNGTGVGINNSNPTEILEVYRGADNSRFKIQNNAFASWVGNDATGFAIETNLFKPITFKPAGVTAMTLDSSGNVGIGVSPNANTKLHLQNNSGDVQLRLTSDNTSQNVIMFGDTVDPTAGAIRYDNASSYMSFETQNNTERMRINSSGQVLIGTTAAFALDGITMSQNGQVFANNFTPANAGGSVGGTSPSLYSPAHSTLAISTASAERMRIDSSGRVGLGTSNPDAKLSINVPYSGTGSIPINLFRPSSDETGYNEGIHFSQYNNAVEKTTYAKITQQINDNANGSEDGSLAFSTIGNGTLSERMLLQSDGDLHVDGDVIAYSTTISDQRLKDDVQTIDNALNKVSNLRGVSYTWNNGNRKGQKDLGLIAQEVEQVLPELVREKEMPMIDGGTYKTVDYEKIVGVLIEAVKELTDKVNKLEAK